MCHVIPAEYSFSEPEIIVLKPILQSLAGGAAVGLPGGNDSSPLDDLDCTRSSRLLGGGLLDGDSLLTKVFVFLVMVIGNRGTVAATATTTTTTTTIPLLMLA